MAIKESIKSIFLKDRKNLSSNAPELFLNCCEFLPELRKLPTKGVYKNGVPEGLIIHYTAGNRDQSPYSALQSAYAQGFCYFFIDAKGTIYQQFDLNKWGQHAGLSTCPVTNRKNVSKLYAGVEIACAGKLIQNEDKYFTWFGKRVLNDDVREFDGSDTQFGKGFYQKFTIPQEQALLTLCLSFIKIFGISPEFILGHDEVAQFRKEDPGGSLSCSMSEFRNILRNKIKVSSQDFA